MGEEETPAGASQGAVNTTAATAAKSHLIFSNDGGRGDISDEVIMRERVQEADEDSKPLHLGNLGNYLFRKGRTTEAEAHYALAFKVGAIYAGTPPPPQTLLS